MKITCDIIKDLIPSYVDDICSEDSKKLINEHIKECESCKEYYKAMKETELMDETIDYEQVSYLKKIQHSFISSALIPILFFAVVTVARGNMSYRGSYIFTVAFIVVGLISQYKSNNAEKQSLRLWILTLVPIFYCTVFFAMLISTVINGTSFLGISPEKFGPLMDIQLIAAMAIEMLIFCVIHFQSATKETTSTANLIFSAVGAGILLGWDALLHDMSTMEDMIWMLFEIVGVSIAIGIFSMVIYRVIVKKAKRF